MCFHGLWGCEVQLLLMFPFHNKTEQVEDGIMSHGGATPSDGARKKETQEETFFLCLPFLGKIGGLA